MSGFDGRAKEAVAQKPQMVAATRRATARFTEHREVAYQELPDLEGLKQYCADVKDHTLENLAYYVQQFSENFESRGGKVHYAATAQEARNIALSLCQAANAKTVVKAKSMVSEELHLNEFLAEHGIEPVETDLGEFIIQKDGEAPSHIVGPAIHKPMQEVQTLFHKLFNTPENADHTTLASAARAYLRAQFLQAEVGFSGANFLVAETGSLITVENEGNIRLSTSAPKVHIAIVGIEKLIPRLSDVPAFLTLLPRAATGQRSSSFVSFISSPKQAHESDGPEQVHVIFLDAERTATLADKEARQALRCIRCSACLNICPVYRAVGGHTYDYVYSGPIGSVLSPNYQGLTQGNELAFASSLCGACGDVCPVKIPLPRLLVMQREKTVQAGLTPKILGLGMKSFKLLATHPRLYRTASKLLHLYPWTVGHLPNIAAPYLKEWQSKRTFPNPAPKSFLQMVRDGEL